MAHLSECMHVALSAMLNSCQVGNHPTTCPGVYRVGKYCPPNLDHTCKGSDCIVSKSVACFVPVSESPRIELGLWEKSYTHTHRSSITVPKRLQLSHHSKLMGLCVGKWATPLLFTVVFLCAYIHLRLEHNAVGTHLSYFGRPVK